MTVKLSATVANNKTLEDFSKLIEQRRKFLNETTEESVAACAIDMLKSVRAATKTANPRKFNKDITEEKNLVHGFKRVGGKNVPCLRVKGSNTSFQLDKNSRFVVVDKSAKGEFNKIFSWVRRSGKKYYLSAPTAKSALDWIKDTEQKRIKKYSGLARFAIGLLMQKIASTTQPTNIDGDARQVAMKTTTVTKTVTGNFDSGHYSMTLEDQLNYALNALKGGPSELETCIQKAMNKITSVVNNKCKDMLGFQKIETPFPELRKRK